MTDSTPTVFGQLSLEERVRRFRAYQEGAEVECFFRGSWEKVSAPSWYADVAYRVTPKKLEPPYIPWQYVDTKYTHAAFDENGDLFFYTEEPLLHDSGWWTCRNGNEFTDCCSGQVLYGVKRGDVPWNKSLVVRPQWR